MVQTIIFIVPYINILMVILFTTIDFFVKFCPTSCNFFSFCFIIFSTPVHIFCSTFYLNEQTPFRYSIFTNCIKLITLIYYSRQLNIIFYFAFILNSIFEIFFIFSIWKIFVIIIIIIIFSIYIINFLFILIYCEYPISLGILYFIQLKLIGTVLLFKSLFSFFSSQSSIISSIKFVLLFSSR